MNRYMIRQAPARLSTISGYYRPNGWAASTRFGGAVSSRRWESTDLGEDQSGHISAGPNEGILFFDSEFLFFVFWYRERSLLVVFEDFLGLGEGTWGFSGCLWRCMWLMEGFSEILELDLLGLSICRGSSNYGKLFWVSETFKAVSGLFSL